MLSSNKKLRNPSILHFATHGFFLPDPPNTNPDDRNCNGLLTAQDLTIIDLRGTNLVFLSTCETRLGKVTNGEGVYGLRRALTLARRELVESYTKISRQIKGAVSPSRQFS